MLNLIQTVTHFRNKYKFNGNNLTFRLEVHTQVYSCENKFCIFSIRPTILMWYFMQISPNSTRFF